MDFSIINSGIDDTSSIRTIAAGDFDGDSDVDLLIATYGNDVQRYDNDGNGSFTENTNFAFSYNHVGSIAAGDFDGDNDLDFDIAFSEHEGSIYQNDGSGNFSMGSNPNLDNSFYGSRTIGDFNGDGYIDIYRLGATLDYWVDDYYGAPIYHYENYIIDSNNIYFGDENGDFTISSVAAPEIIGGSFLTGDFDNDSDLDLIVSGQTQFFDYVSGIYDNDGNGNFTSDNNTVLPVFTDVIKGDFDNDSDLDLFIKPSQPFSGSLDPVVYLNNGSGEFSPSPNSSFVGVAYRDAIAKDFDNDGDLDILLQEYDGSHILNIYSNDGNGNFTPSNSETVNVTYLDSIVAEDLDGDGDADILVAGRDGDSNLVTKIYRNNTLFDSTKNNDLNGTDLAESIDAGIGNDTIYGSLGADSLMGGEGTDKVVYKDSPVGVTVDLLAEIGMGDGSHADGDILNSIEHVEGSDFSDVLIGDLDGDWLYGGESNDTLMGLAGDDNLNGQGGDDILNGGDGIDRLYIAVDNDIVLTDEEVVGEGIDSISNIEVAHLSGGNGNNLIEAKDAVEVDVVIKGGDGDDTLRGGAGEDRLIGENGDDRLSGQLGNDIIHGGQGRDLLIESGNVNFTLSDIQLTGLGVDRLEKIEQVRLTGGARDNTLDAVQVNNMNVTLVGGVGHDSLYGSANADVLYGQGNNDRLEGRLGNDSLYGGNGNDYLFAGSGNDSLVGGNNNDTLKGDAGNDTIDGGAGYDRIVEQSDLDFTLTDTQLTGLGTNTIRNIELARLQGGMGNNTLDASDAIDIKAILVGDAGNDTLMGSQMSDNLYGGVGNDLLDGEMGNDTLVGGAGADIFALESAMGTDTIKDFQDGLDRFGLSTLSFGDLSISNNQGGTAALISDLTNNNELLAVVNNIDAANLSPADFVAI